MKEKKKRTKAKAVAPVVEEAPAKEVRTWLVNCSKCGAALNLKDGGQAYVCPVCGTLLKVKSGVRIVKDIPRADKTLHLSITEQAVQYILAKGKKKRRCIFRRKKNTLETLIWQNVQNGYTTQDNLLVEVDKKGLVVTKA